jgi:RNA polymerase-binding transcription factor DksA
MVSVDASDLSGARKGGSQILEELCEARGLARCVGLAECDVLSAAQKRDLLMARATRLRDEEGGSSALADAPDPRAAELRALQRDLLDERERIVGENRRRVLEAAAALQRNPRPLGAAQEPELAAVGISVFDDESLRELRTTRLDAIDRGLDGLARGPYGDCVTCRRPIEAARLRIAPDTAVCSACAGPARSSKEADPTFGFRRAPLG